MIGRSLTALAALLAIAAITLPAQANTPAGKPAATAAKPTAKPVKKIAAKPAAKTAAKKPAAKAPITATPTGAVLRVAVEGQFAPFSERGKDGKLKGFDVDIANAICAEIKRRCVLLQREWPHIQDGVLGKYPKLWSEVDTIISSVSINDTRRLTSDFTRSYYQIPARFIQRKGTAITFTPDGLAGKRIGVQGETTHDNFATSTFGRTSQIVRYETVADAAQALSQGKVDLVMADSMALEFGTLRRPEGAKLEFAGPSYTDRGWFGDGAGIVVQKGQAVLLAELEKGLEAIQSNGTYAKISKTYFGFDVSKR